MCAQPKALQERQAHQPTYACCLFPLLLAGADIMLTYTIINEGNVMARNVALTVPGVGQLSCGSVASGSAFDLAYGANQTCT